MAFRVCTPSPKSSVDVGLHPFCWLYAGMTARTMIVVIDCAWIWCSGSSSEMSGAKIGYGSSEAKVAISTGLFERKENRYYAWSKPKVQTHCTANIPALQALQGTTGTTVVCCSLRREPQGLLMSTHICLIKNHYQDNDQFNLGQARVGFQCVSWADRTNPIKRFNFQLIFV